ncbi:MAG: aminotransferase class III-fold pyridoxal phosphate-dependent enzyme [Burkholderiales bacterium]|nr:aminotransferase class III-fold pyridoxal phosphate-dependent enzyme [Burkholderiales bacterium]
MRLAHTWLPADTPDNEFNIQIISAHDSLLVTNNQQKIYDAVSSWWCKPLGHGHELIKNSIYEQLDNFEHHIPANAWNAVIEDLSTKLVNIFTQMDKTLYASDGSSAIEMAMKLSYESRVLQNQPKRSKFIALSGAYHGETIFTLGVCGIDSYKKNFAGLLTDNIFIENIPYVTGRNDVLWHDCNFDENYWDNYFGEVSDLVTALIFEPIVQGAAGMKIISKDFLAKLVIVARRHDIHIIADEIMVGLGRLGVLSVCKDIIGFEPDAVCFAKNLTAGSIPMSTVVVNKSISNIYRLHKKAFHHSHTHSCNTLAAKVANNYLDYLYKSDILDNVLLAEKKLSEMVINLQAKFSFILNVRAIGSIAAMELDYNTVDVNTIFKLAVKNGIYLRNIGNILYIMPPIYNLLDEISKIAVYLDNVLSKLKITY